MVYGIHRTSGYLREKVVSSVEALGMRLGGFGLEEQSERQKKSLQSAYIIFWQLWLEGL